MVLKKAESRWGDGIIEQISQDLISEFPNLKGFSPRNLWYIKKWYLFYNQPNEILHQLGAETLDSLFSIPWRHHTEIITKAKTIDEALFYVQKTIENGWSRNVLMNFMSANLYNTQGKAISNFIKTLPEIQSDLAQQTLKDPYTFDFLTLKEGYLEKELEDA